MATCSSVYKREGTGEGICGFIAFGEVSIPNEVTIVKDVVLYFFPCLSLIIHILHIMINSKK